MKFRRRSVVTEDEIPTASMGDISFLLIIFFILTTTFAKDKGIKMELPQTVTQEQVPIKTIIISVEEGGRVYVDGVEKTIGEVAPAIQDIKSREPEKFVIIKSDKNVKYGVVMDVMDALLQIGIKDIALPTEQEQKEEENAAKEG